MLKRATILTRRVFFGWWVVGGGMGLQALLAMLFFLAYGAYAPLWMHEFGWSRTMVALAFSLHRTESGLLGPVHAWLLTRYQPRAIISTGVVILSSGFLLLSAVQSYGQFLVVFLFMAIGASFCGALSVTTVAVNWFERRRSTALAAIHIGFSLGGLAVPIVAACLVTFGWRPVAAASGIVVLACGLPIARLMHRDPESLGMQRDGAVATDGQGGTPGTRQPQEPRVSIDRVLRTRAFWMLASGHAIAMSIAAAIMVHFVIYVTTSLGLELTTAAAMVSLLTLASLGGQVVSGVLGDRVDKRLLTGGAMVGSGAAMATLVAADGVGTVALAAMLQGFTVGVRGPLMGALHAEYFGRSAYAAAAGYSSLVVTMGSILGPVSVGLVVDATGSYATGFMALAVISCVGSLAFFGLKKPRFDA